MADDRNAGLLAAVQRLLEDETTAAEMMDAQLSLLPVPNVERETRGRGRPAGSANKSTLEWSKYIQANYRSPLEFMAETFNRPAQQLSKELDCTPLQAFQAQMICARELAPYLHSKMPAAQGGDREPVQIIIEAGGVDLGDPRQPLGLEHIRGEVVDGFGPGPGDGSGAGDDASNGADDADPVGVGAANKNADKTKG